jgi:hypothetical protein
MTKEELEIAEKAKEVHRAKLEAARAARQEAEEKGDAGENPAGSASCVPGKAKKEVDDDDSENGGEDAAADDAKDAQDDDEDDEGDVEMKDADDGEKATQVTQGSAPGADGAEEEVQTTVSTKLDWGTCLLMMTENGMGMRVPFTHKRLQMTKKGRMGTRVFKTGAADDVMGACVVSGRVELKKPSEPKGPFNVWYADMNNAKTINEEIEGFSQEKRAAMEAEAKKDLEEAAAKEAAAREAEARENSQNTEDKAAVVAPAEMVIPLDFLNTYIARKRFSELPESEAQALEKHMQALREEHDRQMERFKQYNPDNSDQVMVASKQGFLSRIMVDSVPVVDKRMGGKGLKIVKLKGRDSLSSISFLSATDEITEENEAEPVSSSAAAAEAAPMEEEKEEPVEEEPRVEAEVKSKDTPRKLGARRPDLALPDTPPTNQKASNSAALAASSLLDTPMESPNRRIRGKRPASDVALSPSVDARSVARPSLARTSSEQQGSAASTGRGRGRGTSAVRKDFGKRTLGKASLRMTQPSFAK